MGACTDRAVVLKVENGCLMDKEQGDLRTNEVTPFNMLLHPEGQTLLVGVGSAGLKVIDVRQQSGSPPTLHFAQGTAACALHTLLPDHAAAEIRDRCLSVRRHIVDVS